MARVLFLEPYFGGSHKAFAEGIAGRSRHAVDLLTLPGRYWKWRMRGSAPLFAKRFASLPEPDLIVASSMLNLAEFLGLAGERAARAAKVIYFHENQLTYPLPEEERRDIHLVLSQLTSVLTADWILFNSEHQREEMMQAVPGFLRSLPDHKPEGVLARLSERSLVIPPGVDLASLPAPRRKRRSGEATILWNHRWEHDKGKDILLRLVRRLRKKGIPFGLIVTGASRGARSDLFEELPKAAGRHLRHIGYVKEREEYGRLLAASDLVLSTARHEFFGISVVEAIHAGAFPLLPRRLSYPEILNPEKFARCYYETERELFLKADRLLTEGIPPVGPVRRVIARYDWSRIIGRFDRFFSEVTENRGEPPISG